jgi:GNAT superfamily N-acetyltransferase
VRIADLALAPFSVSAEAACRALLGGLPEWFAPAAADAYTADLARCPSWVASAVVAGAPQVLGCISVTAPQRTAFEVHLLAVERSQHGRGVGSALLDVAEQFARRCGARFLHVKTTGPSNPDPAFASTRAFYLARGFTPLFESDRLWGEENPALVLVKAL